MAQDFNALAITATVAALVLARKHFLQMRERVQNNLSPQDWFIVHEASTPSLERRRRVTLPCLRAGAQIAE